MIWIWVALGVAAIWISGFLVAAVVVARASYDEGRRDERRTLVDRGWRGP